MDLQVNDIIKRNYARADIYVAINRIKVMVIEMEKARTGPKDQGGYMRYSKIAGVAEAAEEILADTVKELEAAMDAMNEIFEGGKCDD